MERKINLHTPMLSKMPQPTHQSEVLRLAMEAGNALYPLAASAEHSLA